MRGYRCKVRTSTNLNNGLVEPSQVRRHMPHTDQTGQERECFRQLVHHEAILHTELILRLDHVVVHVVFHLVNFLLNLILRHLNGGINRGQCRIEQILNLLLRCE